ncbi:MAG: hypothetical protein K9L66_00170 [Spirochaetaceae bacterium]|nr:hypothetical protein [Spirochaetaceae bacterium]MCF7947160.1 hypothetical protein [Spirochaetia bacterium]MCF7950025.1 hypothetical protein [Spirochaetaceae bacterium]
MKIRIIHIALVVLFVFSSVVVGFADPPSSLSTEDSITTDISLSVEPQIIAHKGSDIVMSVPALDASSEEDEGGALAFGSGSIGYFDSNAPTTFSFEANALSNSESDGDDVMTTRYAANFSGYDGKEDEGYASGDVNSANLDDLDGSVNITPRSGRIDVALDVEADVEWGDDAGLYGSQFVMTATVN